MKPSKPSPEIFELIKNLRPIIGKPEDVRRVT